MRLDQIKIFDYAESVSTPVSDVLYELERETNLKVLKPQMLAGKLQGRLLSLISKWIKPNRILEVGTFTGYSAICLSEGLTDSGTLDTIEVNKELESMILRYFDKAGVRDQVRLHIGKALDVIPKIEGQFDLVYLDADKLNYNKYYDLLIDRLSVNGWIIADNVLWDGAVIEHKKNKGAAALNAYNQMVKNDPRVENILLPFSDGLMLARKLK